MVSRQCSAAPAASAKQWRPAAQGALTIRGATIPRALTACALNARTQPGTRRGAQLRGRAPRRALVSGKQCICAMSMERHRDRARYSSNKNLCVKKSIVPALGSNRFLGHETPAKTYVCRAIAAEAGRRSSFLGAHDAIRCNRNWCGITADNRERFDRCDSTTTWPMKRMNQDSRFGHQMIKASALRGFRRLRPVRNRWIVS